MLKGHLFRYTILPSLLALGVSTPSFAAVQQTQSDAADAAATNAQAGPVQGTTPSPASSAAAETTASGGNRGGPASDETIVVTGSRIRRPNIDSSAPIASISQDQFFNTGNTNIGDRLNQLSPQLHNTFNSSNSTQFIGTQGLNVLDLRGLGTQRTLTLINGRRQVTSALGLTGNEVDINTIPTDLIERIDIHIWMMFEFCKLIVLLSLGNNLSF